MLIPLHSDAPLYHYPISTVALIVVNVLLFFLWPPYDSSDQLEYLVSQRLQTDEVVLDEMTEEQFSKLVNDEVANLKPDWRMLHFGRGINPVQWLFANFMHADAMHLIGNMVFLWGLGLVVEGKLGWWRFLLVYLLIGTAAMLWCRC